jgi:tRNA(fMet)-specific endonuclease VapC
MRYLLDTSTCIETIRGNSAVVSKVAAVSPEDLAISTISWYELYTGVEKCRDPGREKAKLEIFRNNVHELVFDIPAAVAAARIRADLESRGEMIGPYDVLIASQAQTHGLILVTANTKEFLRITGLVVENWLLDG